MARFTRFTLAAALACGLATPTAAQSSGDYVSDVAFFERVAVGDVEITPFGIIEDSRCLDARICFRNDRLIIAAVLHQGNRMREVPLRLGELTPVPGGALLLTRSGVAPVRNGAIPLHRYSLGIEFIPFELASSS